MSHHRRGVIFAACLAILASRVGGHAVLERSEWLRARRNAEYRRWVDDAFALTLPESAVVLEREPAPLVRFWDNDLAKVSLPRKDLDAFLQGLPAGWHEEPSVLAGWKGCPKWWNAYATYGHKFLEVNYTHPHLDRATVFVDVHDPDTVVMYMVAG